VTMPIALVGFPESRSDLRPRLVGDYALSEPRTHARGHLVRLERKSSWAQ
jgi:hypothetical protein